MQARRHPCSISRRWRRPELEGGVVTGSVDVAALDDLVDGEGTAFELDGRRVSVVRLSDRVRRRRHLQPREGLVVGRHRRRGRLHHRECPQARQREFGLRTGEARRFRPSGRSDLRGPGCSTVRFSSTSVPDKRPRRHRRCPRRAGDLRPPRRVGDRPILHGVTVTVLSGEVHAVMGPGTGRQVNPQSRPHGSTGYRVTSGSVHLDGVDLLALPTWEARPGRTVPGAAVSDRGCGRAAGRRRARAVVRGRRHASSTVPGRLRAEAGPVGVRRRSARSVR